MREMLSLQIVDGGYVYYQCDCSERGVLPIQELIDRANKSQNAMLPKCKCIIKSTSLTAKAAKNISALTATRLTMAVTIKLA